MGHQNRLHAKTSLHLLGHREGMLLLYFLTKRCILQCHGHHQHQILLAHQYSIQCYPMVHPPSNQRDEDHMRLVFHILSQPVHGRLDFQQSGQRQQLAPIRPVGNQLYRSYQRSNNHPSPRQEYHVKEKKNEVQPMQVDPERTTTNNVIQIEDMDVVVNEVGKGPTVIGNSIDPSIQKLIMVSDHESSSSSTAKYIQPRWCPLGLTHTQKRKMQHLRFQEKKKQKAEKQRDELSTSTGPQFLRVRCGRSRPLIIQQDG